MRKPKVSIIILRYKEREELFNCLRSIRESKQKSSYEVIVVDNNKRKRVGSFLKREFSWVKYIESPGNIGYGAGNNLGAKNAQGKYLFILNPDTKVLPGSIDRLVNFLEKNKKIGMVAPNLVDEGGRVFPQVGSGKLTPLRGMVALSFLNKLFPNNPISRDYWMKDVPLDKKREVEVVPGSAFLVRKEIFESLGGFDENFFLYFEEADFCKRVKEAGWKIFIIPEAKIVHYWQPAEGSEKTKKIFSQSRFYYFKKHYGFLSATIVEVFARFSKWHAILFAIILLGTLLRFWQINNLMGLDGDIGWFYLSARDMILTREIPLVGIASSVPVFKQGALFTWMLAAGLWLGNFHPVSGAILTGVLGVVAIWATYRLSSSWFGKRVGILAAAFAATSPYIVIHARRPYHTAPIFPATLLVAWSTYAIYKGKNTHYFLLGLWLAIVYQLELAGFILVPMIALAFLWQRVRVKILDLLKLSAGGLLGLIPFFIWDIKQGVFLQTFGFAAWTVIKGVERMIAFFQGTFFTGSDWSLPISYFARLVFPAVPLLALTLLVFSFALFLFSPRLKQRNLQFGKKLIVVWFIVALCGFVLRGIVSEAYTPLIFLPVIVLLAFFMDSVIAKFGSLGWLLVLSLILINTAYLLRVKFPKSQAFGATLERRLKVVDFIIESADGKPYNLVYRGPGHIYESGDNHYRYLLWWRGNEPKLSAPLTYVLFEPKDRLKGSFDEVYDFDYAKVGVKRE